MLDDWGLTNASFARSVRLDQLTRITLVALGFLALLAPAPAAAGTTRKRVILGAGESYLVRAP